MCQQNLELNLCTCFSHGSTKAFKNNDQKFIKTDDSDYLIRITWKLSKYVKHEWIGIDGMLIEPSQVITEKLTAESIRDAMNNRHCFDFDYVPTEGDTICFETEFWNKKRKSKAYQDHKIMSLIYKNRRWNIDRYDPFYDHLEEIGSGILKLEPC